MIAPEARLGVGSSVTGPGLPTTWTFMDKDTRRWVQLEGPTEVYYDDDEEFGLNRAFSTMQAALDHLDDGVVKIKVSAEGNVLECSTSSEDDITPIVHYPPLEPVALSLSASQIVRRQQLIELDRVASGVDVVSVQQARVPGEKLVFKYTFGPQRDLLPRLWADAFIIQRLSGHRNIVPFRHFVIDSPLSAFVGFTTAFISGGSLDSVKPSTTIKLKWLQELMKTIDELNFKHGVIHQDIALRNMLLDKDQDCLRLCDFALAASIGSTNIDSSQNDGKMFVFSVYELLTGDIQYVKQHPSQIDVRSVIDTREWPAKAGLKLEPGITIERLRKEVIGWMGHRTSSQSHQLTLLTWPPMPEISVYDAIPRTRSQARDRAKSQEERNWSRVHRRAELDPKRYVIRWERPSYKALQRKKAVKKQGSDA